MQNKLQTIQRIIQKNYNQNKEYLDLQNQDEYWIDVLLERDWSMLKTIWLECCGITDDSISTFLNLNWPHLTRLVLVNNKLSRRSMMLMLNCSFMSLKDLNLCNNFIGISGVKYLLKVDLPNLQYLQIMDCQIESEGIKHLTKGRWPNLNALWLGDQNNTQIKIQLNGWQFMDQHQFHKLQLLNVIQTQPICWIRSVLLQKKDVKINESGKNIKNKELTLSIIRILNTRNILKQ